MTSICDIFSEFQRHIDEEQDFREEIRVIVRELEQKGREMLTSLQSVHHSDGLNNLTEICEEVNKKFEDVRRGFAQLSDKLPADQYYRYNDHWRFITQRLCFLAALVHYLNHEELLTRHQCAALLGVKVERGAGFHLDIEDYLSGLLLLASELIIYSSKCGVSFFRRDATEKSKESDERVVGRKMSEEENKHSVKHNLHMLKSSRSLDTKRGYKPPHNVREIVEKAVALLVNKPVNQDLASLSLADSRLKYEVVSGLIRELDHDVPASVLTNMTTVGDVLRYFETEVRSTCSYEDLSMIDLPKNLHIQLESLRFQPVDEEEQRTLTRRVGYEAVRTWDEEAATLDEERRAFPRRTAYPGRDTVITSIRYKRKYNDIKTVKPTPGYVNYYYGF